MLVEFSVENFRSFKGKVSLSMLASEDTNHEDTNVIIMPDGTRLLKSVVIYGANASGKSNLLMAMDFMSVLLFKSRKMNPGEPIEDIKPFKLCPELKDKPSKFEVIFYINNIKYAYGFAATRIEIMEEYLHCFIDKNEDSLVIFSRDHSLDVEYEFVHVEDPGVLKYLCQFNADNKLYLSTAVLFNYKAFIGIYEAIVDLSSFSYIAPYRILRESYFDKEDVSDKARAWVLKAIEMITTIDVGITNVPIRENRELFENDYSWGNDDYWDKYVKILKIIDTSHTALHTQYSANFNLFSEDSTGTRNFFTTAISIAEKMSRGGIFVADEFVHMHTLLIKYIVSLFHDPIYNNKNSQLIFTTHDTNLLNSDIFRRDQIWFLEKSQNTGASDLFSLYDFEIPFHVKGTEIDIEKVI